jgi:hypothetical protein
MDCHTLGKFYLVLFVLKMKFKISSWIKLIKPCILNISNLLYVGCRDNFYDHGLKKINLKKVINFSIFLTNVAREISIRSIHNYSIY